MTVRLKVFYADWSDHSKLDDVSVGELTRDLGDRFTLERIDVEENQELANEYRIRSLPTLIVENDEGVVERFDDAAGRDALERAIERGHRTASDSVEE